MSSVTTPRPEVAAMQARAAVCQTLDGGTEAMREARETYLPKWKAEEPEDWEARLKCTTLFPALSKALDTMVGKPLSEPVVVEAPNAIMGHTENIDMAGRDLDTFAVTLKRDDQPDEQVSLLMKRRNLFGWKLAGIDLSQPE